MIAPHGGCLLRLGLRLAFGALFLQLGTRLVPIADRGAVQTAVAVGGCLQSTVTSSVHKPSGQLGSKPSASAQTSKRNAQPLTSLSITITITIAGNKLRV